MEFAKPHVSNIRNSNIRDLLTKVSKRKIGAQYLAEVRLSKIRRYSEATIRFDFPVTALIGTNGGGKSTVLGAAGLIYRSVAPRTFFVKSGKYDQSMQDWTLTYEHWDQQGKLIVRTARYSKARWNRDPIDRSVVLLGVSRTLPATERKRLTAAHRVELTDVHPPRDIRHRVLGRVQAHGDGPRARHHDPLRIRRARARHGLRHNARPPTLDQALRLRTPRRAHSEPAHREAGHHVILAPTVMKIQPRNDTQAPNNLYN